MPEALLEALLYDHRLVDMYEPKPEGSGKYTKHQAFLGDVFLMALLLCGCGGDDEEEAVVAT